jgi:CRISPR-associated endonuclease/helicase Cas3
MRTTRTTRALSPSRSSIAVLNTVRRATEVYGHLQHLTGDGGAVLVLLHSRFRPPERSAQLTAALADPQPSNGTIVVTTQVLEAGVDVSSSTLFTEAAPWSSVVQRAGRCNRDGLAEGARLLWAEPPRALPYEDRDIAATVEALSSLEGAATTPPALAGMSVEQSRTEHAVLRRRDLVELFDNAPDLSGNDIDVSRFIRDVEELDVQIAWRPLGGMPPPEADPPSRDELCPAPVNEVRDLMKADRQRPVWRFDAQAAAWVRAAPDEIRPGKVLVLDAGQGGYLPNRGWSPKSRAEVPVHSPAQPDPQARTDDAVGSDHATWAPGRWVPLVEHLLDAEEACHELLDALEPLPGLHADHRTAAEVAARLHDLGKAHPVFQETMQASAGDRPPPPGGPWAKSGGSAKPRHGRPHFRHELVTALLLMDSAAHLLDALPEGSRDLAVYLAAAHHGKVRLAVRSLPDEKRPDQNGARFALGVWEGDEVPGFDAPGGHVPPTRLDLEAIALGRTADARPSWTARALAVRDAPVLGPFRLGFLEAVVRLADWRASALGDTSHV